MKCQKDIISRNKSITIFLVFAALLMLAAVPSPPPTANEIHTVVLDAGHGGKDPGNLGTGRYKDTEKDIALDVTLQLGEYLKESFPDLNIIYTRDDDSFPKLEERVEIANDANASIFISIHCNSATPRAYGTETFVMGLHKSQASLNTAIQENASIYLEEDYKGTYKGFDPNDPDTYIKLSLRQNVYLDQSLLLSKNIQDQFRERVGRRDRGVKQAGFYVISFTSMPSALVELGFLTNKEEEDFLHSEVGKTYMASAIYRAFHDYKEKMESADIQPEDIPEPDSKTTEPEGDDRKSIPLNELVVNETIDSGIYFEVQILTSSKKIEKTPENFNGLANVDEYISSGLYKYATGKTRDFEKAKTNQELLKNNGFPGAFVIALKNGKRIDLQEALAKYNK
ncbi:N-acetylmuramoyl-L-alanine amidase family protein [Halocola ammonii]